MKKTTQIHIAGTLFYIEENAYAILEGYLDSIKMHFEHNPDREEILADIEGRIAEKLSEANVKVVTTKHVEDVIAAMGTVEELSDEEESGNDTAGTGAHTHSHKRLYRNPDEAIIAGVASGLGYYFGVHPTVVRILFVLVTLAGGSGILIYVILWFALPEARTATQKLEMRGDKVTLSNVKDMIKEKVEEVKNRAEQSGAKNARGELRTFLESIVAFIKKGIIPIVRTLIGFLFAMVAFIAAVAVTIVAGILVFNIPVTGVDPVVAALANGPLFYLALAGVYLAIALPVIAIFTFGLALIRGKRIHSGKFGIVLVSLWAVSLIVVGVAGSREAFRAHEIIRNDPHFATQTQVIPTAAFSKLVVSNGKMVTYQPGTAYSVSVEGTGYDIENLTVEAQDDTLTITNKTDMGICLFCHSHSMKVIVTSPFISDLTLSNASSFTGPLSTDHVAITLSNASRADVAIAAKDVSIQEENASTITASGKSSTLDLKLSNISSANLSLLSVNAITANLENGSRATVSPLTTLSVAAHNSSRLIYSGSPAITQDLQNGSSIRKSTDTTDTPTEE